MQIGMIGLGKMGMNMVRRLLKGRHDVVAYDASAKKIREIRKEKVKAVYSLEELKGMLKAPRIVWLMIPAGQPVDDTVVKLMGVLNKGDILIDGGNSFYKDDIRRAGQVRGLGIHYMDVGTSGGIWGLKEGYCLMAGGDRKIFTHVEPILRTLAPKDGYLYCGPVGAGHFVKMVHNGIEYGMMSAYSEGFEILNASPYAGHLNFAEVAHLWNQGSVVRSWLLELAEDAFKKDKDLSTIKGYVADSGEGRWTVQQAVESGVPAPVIALSLFNRFRSQQPESFSDKLQAALRREFGGHAVVGEKKTPARGRTKKTGQKTK